MGVRQHNTAKVGILREVAAVRGGGLLIEIGDTGRPDLIKSVLRYWLPELLRIATF
jgi:hypothetical protein